MGALPSTQPVSLKDTVFLHWWNLMAKGKRAGPHRGIDFGSLMKHLGQKHIIQENKTWERRNINTIWLVNSVENSKKGVPRGDINLGRFPGS